ncbi:unnamed protein product, partial [Amoebophrya sp. A25]
VSVVTEEWINSTQATSVYHSRADAICAHWVFFVALQRCDLHKQNGHLSEDVNDSIVGHEVHNTGENNSTGTT